jgi:hypothetical protein
VRRITSKHDTARVPVVKNTLLKVDQSTSGARLPQLTEGHGVGDAVVGMLGGQPLRVLLGVVDTLGPRELLVGVEDEEEVDLVGLGHAEEGVAVGRGDVEVDLAESGSGRGDAEKRLPLGLEACDTESAYLVESDWMRTYASSHRG